MGRTTIYRALGTALAWVCLGAAPFAFAQEPTDEWTLSIGARESNEFDRVLNEVPEGDLILDNANFAVGYESRTERSRYGIFGRAGFNAYREGDGNDQLTYGAGFSWSYTPSSRYQSTLFFGADRGLQAETLSNLGVLAPGVTSSAAHAGWSFQYRTSQRTTLSTQVAYEYVRFQSERPIAGSQIVLPESPFRDDFPGLFPETGDQGEVPLPDAEQNLLDILAREGFAFDTSGSNAGSAIFGLAHQTSEYTTLGFDLGAGYRRIDRGDERLLSEGAEGAFRVWAQRRSGQSGSWATAYEVHRSLITDPATTIQSATGGYSYLPKAGNLSLRLLGGASYYRAETGVSSLTPVLDGQFDAGLTRTTRLSAAYRRQFSQSIGYGPTLLIDYAHVSLSQDIGPKLGLTLLGGMSFGADPLLEGSHYDAAQAGTTVSYQIVEAFEVGASFFVLKTDQQDSRARFDTDRKVASVFVTYTARWR